MYVIYVSWLGTYIGPADNDDVRNELDFVTELDIWTHDAIGADLNVGPDLRTRFDDRRSVNEGHQLSSRIMAANVASATT